MEIQVGLQNKTGKNIKSDLPKLENPWNIIQFNGILIAANPDHEPMAYWEGKWCKVMPICQILEFSEDHFFNA